jgi:hypothetical protein
VISETVVQEAPAPSVAEIWRLTIDSVAPLTQKGDFARADSVLSRFAAVHDGTCEAAESGFVRALLRLYPPGGRERLLEAISMLDSFAASTCLSPSRATEVALVRSYALAITKQAIVSDSTALDEVRKLKEQLDAARKELERLRLRVIPPGR